MNSPPYGRPPGGARIAGQRPGSVRGRRRRMTQEPARSRCKALVKRGLLLLGSVLISLLAVEGVARLCLWLKPPSGHVSRWEYRQDHPPAYRGPAFDNTECR